MNTMAHLLFTFILVLSSIPPADAQDSPAARGKRVFLPSGESHDGWFFGAGDEVVIEGTVLGDVYAAGGNIRIEGRVVGDLLVAGGQVLVTGEVTDDIRAAGGSVQIDGLVGKNVSAAGGSVHVGKRSEIQGGILLAGGDVSVAGVVRGGAHIGAGSFTLTGVVDRDVMFAGGRIVVAPGSHVGGKLDVILDDTAAASIERAAVAGTLSIKSREETEKADTTARAPWFRIFWIGSLLLTALVWVLLLPRSLDAVASRMKARPGIVLLWGLGGVVGVPLVVLVLCLTILGIPLGIALGVLYFMGFYLAAVVSGAGLGLAIRRGEGKLGLFLAAFFGILVLQLLALIPVVKVVVILGIVIAGLGALLSTAYAALRPSTN